MTRLYSMQHSAPPPGRELPMVLPGFAHVNRYWDQSANMPAAKILPGEFYVTTHNELVTTVLGSCVAACIRDSVFGIGGMNHFMLAEDRSGSGAWGASDSVSTSTRYGSYAMERLINEILKYGGDRRNLEVKVFGGGRILAQMTDVGRSNVEFVMDYLRTEGLHVVAQDVGDVYPRKVIYFPTTGRVRVKRLRALHNDTILQREKAYLQNIQTAPVQGDVELF